MESVAGDTDLTESTRRIFYLSLSSSFNLPHEHFSPGEFPTSHPTFPENSGTGFPAVLTSYPIPFLLP